MYNVKAEASDEYIKSGDKKIYYDNEDLQNLYLEDTEQDEIYDYDDYKDWVNDYSEEDFVSQFGVKK